MKGKVVFIISQTLNSLIIIKTIFDIITNYSHLPNEVPVHYGFGGEVDKWGDKSILWVIFGLAIMIFLVINLIIFISPKFSLSDYFKNNAFTQDAAIFSILLIINTLILFTFWYITNSTINIAMETASDLGSFFIISIIFVSSLIPVFLIYNQNRKISDH